MGTALRSSQVKPKPAGSEGLKPPRGYIQFRHQDLLEVFRLCKPGLEDRVVWLVMSLANQYRRDGRYDGWTGLLQTKDIAQAIGIRGVKSRKKTTPDDDPRGVNWALQRLVSAGVLEQKKAKSAKAADLIPDDEYGEAKQTAIVLRARIDEWPKLKSWQELEPPVEEPPVEEPPVEEPPGRASGPIRLHPHPIVLYPGKPAPPIPISPEAQRYMRFNPPREINLDGYHVQAETTVDVVISGESLSFSAAASCLEPSENRKSISSILPAPPAPSNQNRKSISSISPTSADSKRDSLVVMADEIGVRMVRGLGIEPDAKLRLKVAEILRGNRCDGDLDEYIQAVGTKREQMGPKFKWGMLSWVAENMPENLERRRAGTAAQQSEARPRGKTIEELMAESQARRRAKERP